MSKQKELRPLNDFVAVRIEEFTPSTPSGLFMPANPDNMAPERGIVTAVSAKAKEGGVNVGDEVIILRGGGHGNVVDGVRLIRLDHLLAVRS